MAASFAFIACRVPYETKARLRRLAELDGTNESAVMRRVLDSALALTVAPGPGDELSPSQDRPGRNRPVVVRLTADDRRRLQERADSRGIAAATYMAVLVHTQLAGVAPPLPKAEYLMLRETIAQLTGIARNLNRLMRALDLGGEITPPGRAEFAAMLKVAEALRDHFRELIRANDTAWSRNGTTRR
jgi:hypothetical protein